VAARWGEGGGKVKVERNLLLLGRAGPSVKVSESKSGAAHWGRIGKEGLTTIQRTFCPESNGHRSQTNAEAQNFFILKA